MKINKCTALILALVMTLSLFAGCRSTDDSTSSDASTVNSDKTSYGVVDIVESEASGVESTDSTVSENESVVSDSSSEASEELGTDNIVSVGDGGNTDGSTDIGDLPPTFIESVPDTPSTDDTKPVSSAENPFVTSPNSKGKVITVEIKAGTSEFYKISRAANKIFTINDPNAYVVYNGKTYEANNGTVSFFIESDELANAQILFEIGNKGTAAASFTITIAPPLGTWDNKEPIEIVGQKITKNLEAGLDEGYCYQHVATKTGKIRFYLLSGTTTAKLDALYSSTEAEEDLKSDSTGAYIEFSVTKGDKIPITIAAKASGGVSFPATVVEWMITYP